MVIDVAPAPEELVEAAPLSQPRRPSMPGALVVALAGVVVFSAVAVFFGAFAFGFSALQEHRSQQQLYASFRGLLDPSSPFAPSIGGEITPATPVALLNAPGAGLHNVVVVEGTSSSDLMDGPGHLRDSPLPGQFGESILMGKATTAGAPFGGITNLRKGELITATTGQGTFRFVVEGKRVAGDRLPELPLSGALLTLVTSAGSGWLGRLTPSHLVYVDAALQGTAVAAPPGRPTAIPAQEIQGHGDPTAWPFVVFWAEALLAAGVVLAWMWSRLGLARAWLIGTPVLFGIFWGLSTEVLRLLPNVY
jgi:sortase A